MSSDAELVGALADGVVTYERLRDIVALAPIGIGVVDLQGRAILTNGALREMLGYSEEEFARLHWREFTHPDDVAPNEVLFGELVAGRRDRFELEKRFFHKDGHLVWGRLSTSVLRNEAGGPDLAIGMLENITQRRRLEEQLRHAEATYRLLVEQVPAVVYVAGLGVGEPWSYVSPQIEPMFGYSVEEWLADPNLCFSLVHPDDRDMAFEAARTARQDPTGRATVAHYRMRRRSGGYLWVRDEFQITDDGQGNAAYRGMLLDVTREKELEARLEHQAFHDPLTQLANRELLRDRIEHGLRRTMRQTRHAAVVYVDLDDFKTVNDSLGHAAGDELLRSVADRIRDTLRPGDSAGRLGGDEFALLLEDLDDPSDAVTVAERVQRAVQRPHRLAGKTVVVSASLGVANLGADDSADTALRNADLAMYRAKSSGKGRVASYEPSLHQAAVRRLDLRSALEGALEGDELSLHLQPIVDLTTARPLGAEALLRWRHIGFGHVSPEDFVPVAEETGVIGPIGEWVLRRACRWLAEQHRAGHPTLSVSVNVSPVQLQDPGFADLVARILRGVGVAPADLVLELTERALMSERSWRELRALRELGVRIAIDDFGTGYASLAYLRELTVDVLKVDRAFVAELSDDARSQAVPRAITQLSTSLGLTVVAEGIETPRQWRLLQGMGVHAGQGFLFARPAPPAQTATCLDRPLGPPPV